MRRKEARYVPGRFRAEPFLYPTRDRSEITLIIVSTWDDIRPNLNVTTHSPEFSNTISDPGRDIGHPFCSAIIQVKTIPEALDICRYRIDPGRDAPAGTGAQRTVRD